MRVFRYPLRSLVSDYLRALAGIAVGLAVLLAVPASAVILFIFGGVTLLFLVFGLRTVQRHLLQIAVTDAAIGAKALATKSLPWNRLESVKLRYYGGRRQSDSRGGSGFMQLTLKGADTSLTLESSLTGFDWILWRAAKALRENGMALDPTSAGNLLDLGIDPAGDQPPPVSLAADG